MHEVVSLGLPALRLPNILPFATVDRAASVVRSPYGEHREVVSLPHCHAKMVWAQGVSRESRKAVLYLHGGAFLCCGTHTHAGIINRISRYANVPVLAVNYRMLPKHSIADSIADCRDAYNWLRSRGLEPEDIVIAGDSAGGYLTLALTQQLVADNEKPAAMVMLSPLLRLESQRPRTRDAMFPNRAFAALTTLIQSHDGQLYEPLDHVTEDLPPALIHVSGTEGLVHDAREAQAVFTAAGVPLEVHVWPGQIHVFQIAAGWIPEATSSLRQIGEYIHSMLLEQI